MNHNTPQPDCIASLFSRELRGHDAQQIADAIADDLRHNVQISQCNLEDLAGDLHGDLGKCEVRGRENTSGTIDF